LPFKIFDIPILQKLLSKIQLSDMESEEQQLQPESDEAIVRRVQQGDKEAFGIVIARYEKKLSRYARKFLAGRENIQDLVQDVFLKTYQNLQSFDPDLKFQPWIYRIAHNVFVNGLKKIKRSPFHFFDFDTLLSYSENASSDTISSESTEGEDVEMTALMEQALETLPVKYAEVLILHFSEGLSYKEISDVLQIPIGTVGVRINRGKTLLKEQLRQEL
jgi:RNA polymerase sigma-70 factor (ECF subfamily)